MLEKIEKDLQDPQEKLKTEKNASIASSLSEYTDKANEIASILRSGL